MTTPTKSTPTKNITLWEAIARMEGWLNPNSLCRKNHNPGNIEYGSFAIKHGAIGKNGRFAIFANDAKGFDALKALLQEKYSHLSIQEALLKYAPPIENDTHQYIKNVCDWCAIDPTSKVGDYLQV